MLELMMTLCIASLIMAVTLPTYSQGEDGDSKGPLNAKASRNDIVRANNGSHIGLGEDC